jgi:hypothetical protein
VYCFVAKVDFSYFYTKIRLKIDYILVSWILSIELSWILTHRLNTCGKNAYSASNYFRYEFIICTPKLWLQLGQSEKGAKSRFWRGFRARAFT